MGLLACAMRLILRSYWRRELGSEDAIAHARSEWRSKGRSRVAPSCCPRKLVRVVALWPMPSESTKTLTSPVLVVGREAKGTSALRSKVAIMHAIVMSKIRNATANERGTLQAHGQISSSTRSTVLDLHGEVFLSTLGQKPRQLVVESFRLADASTLLAFTIRVKEARCTILGAELLSGGWTQANTFSIIRVTNPLHTTLPPACPTLRLHILDDPVVCHHLDLHTLLKVVNVPSLQALNFHHSAIRRSLFSKGRCRLCVGVQPVEDVESTPKPRKVWIDHRIPLAKVHSTPTSTSKTSSTSASKTTSKASLGANMPKQAHQRPQVIHGFD